MYKKISFVFLLEKPWWENSMEKRASKKVTWRWRKGMHSKKKKTLTALFSTSQ